MQSRIAVCLHCSAKVMMDVHAQQVDNLRTNHRGTFVLKDSKFRCGSSVDGVTTLEVQTLLPQMHSLLPVNSVAPGLTRARDTPSATSSSAGHPTHHVPRRWLGALSTDPPEPGAATPQARHCAAMGPALQVAARRSASVAVQQSLLHPASVPSCDPYCAQTI